MLVVWKNLENLTQLLFCRGCTLDYLYVNLFYEVESLNKYS